MQVLQILWSFHCAENDPETQFCFLQEAAVGGRQRRRDVVRAARQAERDAFAARLDKKSVRLLLGSSVFYSSPMTRSSLIDTSNLWSA